jgi:hypothetical protein
MEMTPAPTHTIMNTISNSSVLSSALVAELKVLQAFIHKNKTYTASMRQKMKGPHRSPKEKIKNLCDYAM